MQKIILVAGGTAGHINAALSLGEYFTGQNWQVEYLSGTRYLDKKLLPADKTIFLETRALRTKNPFLLIKNLTLNLISFIKMLIYFLKGKPKLIIGAGGYVCGPTLMAGYILGKPVFIIEQNAIAGVTNKILQHISAKVFTHFKSTKGISEKKVLVTGNPVRGQIKKITHKPIGDKLNILVFGGSLGATQINDGIKSLLNFKTEFPMDIVHQVGKGNGFEVENKSDSIAYKQVEYIDDMAKYYEWADIIIARAGASTIAELRVVQKPSILIPYPAATDNHQYYNAIQLKEENLFDVVVVDQSLKNEKLAETLMSILKELKSNNKQVKDEKLPSLNPNEIIYKEVVKYVRN